MLAQTRFSSEKPNDETSSINLEDLFDSSRILVSPKLYKAVLYFPFALLLLLTRLIAGVLGFLILSLLPRNSQKRSAILKGICKVLGIIVEVDDKYNDENAKLMVANHVSLLDRLAVNIMVPCSTISKDFHVGLVDSLSFWKDVDISHPRDLTNEEIVAFQMYIEGSSVRVLHFPECATTNGKIGLLKFHPGVFSINTPIQPVLIHVSSSSFMPISPSVLGSTTWADIFWSFILPSTFFRLKTLPSMVKLPEESANDFSKRVQQTMASAMDLKPTAFTSSDKEELVKRLQTSALSAVPPARSKVESSNQNSQQLSGLCRSTQSKSTPTQKLTMNTAAETFGKSPKERMASYQERRKMLLEAARQKYLEKQSI
ncbi:ancient ubiquitous protein 1 homolog [Trichonephila clavata]|uniref:Ancient ubiquitous protein 1 homolog n=1 Tax=Trichonephila clavata TaxID=2740835 RepID=A0A8X6HZQ5_TRICU|nr:ancient ubiquitous protein 1 homolog [Trichonephila clavata]